jgi:hypothetical protein
MNQCRVNDSCVQVLEGIFMRKIKPAWSYVSVFAVIAGTAAVIAGYYAEESGQTKEIAVIETKAMDVDRRVTKLEQQLLDQLQKNNETANAMVSEVRALRTDWAYYQKYGTLK